MTKTDMRYFTIARQAATVSDFPKIHVGCIAVYQNQIIGIGSNTQKTHPMQKYYNRFRNKEPCNHSLLPKMHAEIRCLNTIRRLSIDFGKVKLYVYRCRMDQDFGIARPCPSCMAAIRDIGIRDIYYTTNDGFCYERLENK